MLRRLNKILLFYKLKFETRKLDYWMTYNLTGVMSLFGAGVMCKGLEHGRNEAVFQHFNLKGNHTERMAEIDPEPIDDERTRSTLWKIR